MRNIVAEDACPITDTNQYQGAGTMNFVAKEDKNRSIAEDIIDGDEFMIRMLRERKEAQKPIIVAEEVELI